MKTWTRKPHEVEGDGDTVEEIEEYYYWTILLRTGHLNIGRITRSGFFISSLALLICAWVGKVGSFVRETVL